ncbi:type I polyketide synthase [Cupriavidus sp. BIS7]|uniref:type I polyketide synthase n=1 Tax=Cupriavidus sp. BIS7 TaxID=1217718 RepID=UPI0002ECA460|nr:type I polyketide synthase [Cupriavidus sp. BIS7]
MSVPEYESSALAESIAVVGLACRFPASPNADAYWRNLLDGRDCSRRIDRATLCAAGVSPALADDPDYVPVAATIEAADQFDAPLFGYSRADAESLDPQQRLFLQAAWHALEHAGYAPRHVPHRTGVFAACRMSTYPALQAFRDAGPSQVRGIQSLLGNDKDYLATRTAYKLGLTGPALTVQTACSSSLVAVHLACESLRSGECDMALAGGVAVSFPMEAGYLYQPGMIFSPDGTCRPFDAAAQGTYAGHGLGIVVLRRLEDAMRDGDTVMAVLRGSAINNDGERKVGYTAPSVAGQHEVIREAMSVAGIAADDVDLIEAHGTATPLGDPIEIEALRGALAARDPSAPRCRIGSVKGNLGHLDTAAGIASLIKTVLAVHHGTMPPGLHAETPNPALRLDESPLALIYAPEPWPRAVRTAGVSSFGIGGTNCHVIVQSAPPAAPRSVSIDDAETPALLLSAASPSALRRMAAAYAEAWDAGAPPAGLAAAALQGRALDLNCRLAMPLIDEARPALAAFAENVSDVVLHVGQGQGQHLWLFGGQGTQWPGMSMAMSRQSAAFDGMIERCCAICDPLLPLPLRAVMDGTHPSADAALADMTFAQPAIVAFELAMAAHWQSIGLRPDAVIGHSVGEYAAAVVAGHYTPEAILPLVVTRGRMMQAHAASGAMLAAFADDVTLQPCIARCDVDIAAWNGARHVVLSGAAAAIDTLAAELDADGIAHARLAVSGAAHSRLLDPMLDAYAQAAATVRAETGNGVVLWSTLLGEAIDADTLNRPDYWRRHVRDPVRYHQALGRAVAEGVSVCLELSPDAPLTGMGSRADILATTDGPGNDHELPARQWIASARRGQGVTETQQDALLSLFAGGAALSWPQLLPCRAPRAAAPLYPFDTTRYWYDDGCDENSASGPSNPANPSSAGTPTDTDKAINSGRPVAISAAATLDLPRLALLNRCATALHGIYVDTMVRQCVGDAIDERVTLPDIMRGGRLQPRHRQLLARLLRSCVEDGYYRCDDSGRYTATGTVPYAEHQTLLQTLRDCCEGLDVIADTIARGGSQLHAMMRGDVDPVAVIFPDSAETGVEVLYRDFSFGHYFNQIAAAVADGLVHARENGQPFRVLEVGGGTGGTTTLLLDALAPHVDVHYTFTDISAVFTRRAQARFGHYDFVEYREFDLEKAPAIQGFAAGEYDLIVAANVIHATRHAGHALAMLHTLLQPGGHLMMREITQPMRLFDFVFGPLVAPLQDEAARGGELFLSTDRWAEHCREAGFVQTRWLPENGTPTATMSEHILLARASDPPQHAAAFDRATSGVTDTGNPVLGYQTDANTYVADWSSCAADSARWHAQLDAAAQALRNRAGHRKAMIWQAPDATPNDLASVRLRWHDGPFGAATITLDTRDGKAQWQPVAAAHTASDAAPSGLPIARPAPDTRFEQTWQPFPCEPTDAVHASVVEIATHDAPASTLAALAEPLRHALANAAQDALIVVTRNACAPPGHGPVWPAHHAIWGLMRVAAAEQPNRALAVIDIPDDDDGSALAVGQGAVAAGARWIAVRNGTVFVPSLMPVTESASPVPPGWLRGTGWHVVTGGFGGLGRMACAWLAAHGASRIALLAPRGPDPKQCNDTWREELSARSGCTVLWLPCNTADTTQVSRCIATLYADGGIGGAIHAAGVLDDAPLTQLTAARISAVTGVKAAGAEALREALHAHGARYLLLYSSAAATLGTPGQGAHALASGYLDGMALRETSGSMAVISLVWGAWGEIGRAANAALRERLAEAGMETISTAEGRWHLDQAIMRGAPVHIAMRLALSHPLASRVGIEAGPIGAGSHGKASAEPRGSDRAADSTVPALHVSGQHTTDLTAIEAWLRARIALQLRMNDPGQLRPRQDLLQQGLDSLQFLELNSAIRRATGIRLDPAQAYRDMTLDGLGKLIATAVYVKKPDHADTAPTLTPDPVNRHAPFPLTPIQHAYWLGRTELILQGGMACHVLFEWDLDSSAHGLQSRQSPDGFDIARFEQAWNALIARHDMLRMVVEDNGMQRILPEVPTYRMEIDALDALSTHARERHLLDTRERMAGAVPSAGEWPLFEVRVSQLGEGRLRLHMNLDLLQFDVQSFKVMMDDLSAAYAGQRLPPPSLSFRDYVLAVQAQRETTEWQASWRYWQAALHTLPPAPQLPMAANAAEGPPRITTRQGQLPAQTWTRLATLWKGWGVTPSAGLLTVFACVLARACRRPDFTLNLTFFDRQPLHAEVNQLIGDFTSVLLMDFDIDRSAPLRAMIEQTQARLWERLAHSRVNGVEVLRSYTRMHGGHGSHDSTHRLPAMPVVFTSMLGMTLDGQPIERALTHLLGEPIHVFTQTPQVWLDHQVMEIDGDLVYHWYCMDDVLGPGVAERLFAEYTEALATIAAQPEDLVAPGGTPTPARIPHPAARPPGDWPGAIDLRDVEAHLRCHPMVRAAEIRLAPDGSGPCAWVVAADATDIAGSPASPDVAIDTRALPRIEGPILTEFGEAWRALEQRAREGIHATLRRHGLFANPVDGYTVQAVVDRLGATATTARIVRQWLSLLCASGGLTFDGLHYRAAEAPAPSASQSLPAPAPAWLATIAQYLDRCLAAHDGLLQGNTSARHLLLGDDDAIAHAFYRDNPVAAALNDAVSAMVAQLSDGRGDFRVLEVGAGTGATTRRIMPALADRLEIYHFTDISRLFFDHARIQFGNAPPMRYSMLDLNRATDFTAHPAQGYDAIIAVNVLHDVADVTRSLQRLRRLLRPGGHLLLVEATERDSALQRASIGFMESLNGLDDARAIDGNPMLDLSGWTLALRDAGLTPTLTWPRPADGDWRQHLIVAQATRSERFDPEALSAHLRTSYPDLSPPRWQQCERLPEPAPPMPLILPTGTKDIGKAPAVVEPTVVDPKALQAVSAVWEALLARPVGPDTDFFRSDGDSLIATRMVAQVNRLGIGPASLRQVFEHPRLADFCAAMMAVAQAEIPGIHVLARGNEPRPVFACHASDGGVAAYHQLAGALGCTVSGLDAEGALSVATLGALAQRHVDSIRHAQPRGPYTLLGWSYGTFLAAEAAQRLHDAGEAVRVVLLDPVSRADFHCSNHAALLRLLCQGPAAIELPSAFEQWQPAAQTDWFLAQMHAARRWPDGKDGKARLDLVAHLLGLLTQAPAPTAPLVPCLRIDARRRPAHWRAADDDWHAWTAGPANAQFDQHWVDAGHWDLLLDVDVVARVAALWREWDAATAYKGDTP